MFEYIFTVAFFIPSEDITYVTVKVFDAPGAIFPAGVKEPGINEDGSAPDIFMLSTLKLSVLVF